MEAKLTLKLNQEVIESAKKYASDQKISLSRLVESYLRSLTGNKEAGEDEISPYIKSLATGTKIPADLDLKEYSDHLLKKYQ